MPEEQNNTKVDEAQLLQKPPVSKSPLAKMFVPSGKLISFKNITPEHVEIKVPLPAKTLDPFKICTDLKVISEKELLSLGYLNEANTEWFLGSYEAPGAAVKILIEKQTEACYYAFL
jgi:hypothetical protein